MFSESHSSFFILPSKCEDIDNEDHSGHNRIFGLYLFESSHQGVSIRKTTIEKSSISGWFGWLVGGTNLHRNFVWNKTQVNDEQELTTQSSSTSIVLSNSNQKSENKGKMGRFRILQRIGTCDFKTLYLLRSENHWMKESILQVEYLRNPESPLIRFLVKLCMLTNVFRSRTTIEIDAKSSSS